MFLSEATSPDIFSGEWWQQLGADIVAWCSSSGLKLLLGLVVLFILFKLINLFAKGIRKAMMKKSVEKTIVSVTYSVIRKGLKILVFLMFLGFIGVETAGIGSIIASVGVAIGLALQGSLSNLAGGIIIFVMHPFRIGDYIEAQGLGGTVEDIHMFYTQLVTPDNKVIMMPNGSLSNGNIINYSLKELRRVDLMYGIGYNESFERARDAILALCAEDERILVKEKGAPADPFVKLAAHSESSIDIAVRIWVKNSDYWEVYFRMQEDVKKKFDELGIEIPYPQLDVHMPVPAPKGTASTVVRGEEGEKVRERKAKEALAEPSTEASPDAKPRVKRKVSEKISPQS